MSHPQNDSIIDNKRDELAARQREIDECNACQRYIADKQTFYPPHFASRGCESGKKPHCTCDTCF